MGEEGGGTVAIKRESHFISRYIKTSYPPSKESGREEMRSGGQRTEEHTVIRPPLIDPNSTQLVQS